MRTCCVLFCVALPLLPVGAQREASDSSRAVLARYQATWDKFVVDFRSTAEPQERLQLLQTCSEQLNTLLEPHRMHDSIRRVLPRMAEARAVDLQPTFLAVVQQHPQERVRAEALYYFARYLGNNRRLEECDVALAHLKRQFGNLRHQPSLTYAEAADQTRYFFHNLAVGCEAPIVSGEDTDGQLFSLSDYRGKVVMLRFWGDWCPACRAMYPFERELTKAYRGRRFALIGVNSDGRETCREAQQRNSLAWRSFWDGGTTTGAIATTYQVQDWPRIVIIDAEGVIRMNSRGLDKKYVTDLLDRLIREAEQEVADDA